MTDTARLRCDTCDLDGVEPAPPAAVDDQAVDHDGFHHRGVPTAYPMPERTAR